MTYSTLQYPVNTGLNIFTRYHTNQKKITKLTETLLLIYLVLNKSSDVKLNNGTLDLHAFHS